MLKMFTARTAHIRPQAREEALDALGRALQAEHPNFYIDAALISGGAVALTIAPYAGAPDQDPAVLDGWGHGFLTLSVVDGQ